MTKPNRALHAALLFALMLLAGCAAEKSYRNAQTLQQAHRTEEALAEYQQALQKDPTNAKFRIGYLNARDAAVNRWLAQAETERAAGGTPSELRDLYTRVLGIDPGNRRAQAGITEIDRDQKSNALVSRARTDAQQGQTESALSRLREVLNDQPQHAGALKFRAQLEAQRAKPKAQVDAKLAEAFRRPVSLEFKDAPLKQVFEILSRSSGLNFVVDKDIRGDQRTTLFLRNSTIADAVGLVLLTNQLEQRVLDGSTVLIFPNTPTKLREYQQLTVKAFVLSSADAKVVANTLKSILKSKDVVVDEKQNMIVMRDSPEAVQMAEKLVALHDQPEAEVMLDVEILEIKRTKLLQLGVQYPAQAAFAPMTSASGVQLTLNDLKSLNSATTSVSVSGIGVQANNVVTDVNVLANPRIRSRNKEKAKIQVGQRVPNITSTSTSTGFVAETVQYVDVGLKLEVEPTVSPDGEVVMKVGLEVSNILGRIQTKGGSIAYEIGTRNANTVLRLRDGENQVLAGLINDEDRRSVTGLPGLSSIPGIGGTLFGNTQDEYQKSEIVLSITPRIVRAAFRPELAMSEFESGTEASLRTRTSQSTAAPAAALEPNDGPRPATATPASEPARSGANPNAVAAQAAQVATPPPPASSAAPASLPSLKAADPSEPAAKESAANDSPPPATSNDANETTLRWGGAQTAAVGSTLTVDLWAAAPRPLSIVPITVGYDPRVLSVVSVDQGDFMANAGTSATFTKRAETASGVMRMVISASGGAAKPAQGTLVRMVFKALAPSDGSRISLSSGVTAVTASGEALSFPSPADWPVQVK